MARKKVAKKKAKKTSSSKSVTSYEQRLANYAQKESEREQAGPGNAISVKGKRFTFQGGDLGETLDVIVLDYSFVNAYYDTPYDEDNLGPPACFSISHSGEDMQPDDVSPDSQGSDDGFCAGCWADVFGSDDRGKGKACKNLRRLAVIPADTLGNIDEDTMIAFVSCSPTSGANWKLYVNKLAQTLKRPSFGVITRMSFDSSVSYEKLQFEVGGKVPNKELDTLIALRESVQDDLMRKFDVSNYAAPKKAATKKKAGKKASKKKGKRKSKFS